MTIASLRESGESTETAVPSGPFFTLAELLVLSVGILLLAIPGPQKFPENCIG